MFTYIVCYTHHCNGRVEGGYPARFHLQHEVASRMMKMGSLDCTVHEADPIDLTRRCKCKARHFLDFLGYLGSLVVLAWHIFLEIGSI
jgi:hypothetical protein